MKTTTSSHLFGPASRQLSCQARILLWGFVLEPSFVVLSGIEHIQISKNPMNVVFALDLKKRQEIGKKGNFNTIIDKARRHVRTRIEWRAKKKTSNINSSAYKCLFIRFVWEEEEEDRRIDWLKVMTITRISYGKRKKKGPLHRRLISSKARKTKLSTGGSILHLAWYLMRMKNDSFLSSSALVHYLTKCAEEEEEEEFLFLALFLLVLLSW